MCHFLLNKLTYPTYDEVYTILPQMIKFGSDIWLISQINYTESSQVVSKTV